ncbi:BrnA antitoxin family protein [Xenorhabdus sp. TS4]|uniref:BrnA antitoxin family protein n=1 Tax=Xenorhabdus sp. TS4 TaxID=1873483 RepID=UPI0021026FCA|nr:BrnA antitoxin family protein [Xenorhabdus sp. TS4]MBC8950174.1 hypothetical protein [Xenorhabdus sp. TS4]
MSDDITDDLINEALDLQPISIRLNKSLIEDLKMIADLNGLGYQPLIRQVLNRFANSEKKRILTEVHNKAMKSEKRKSAPQGGLTKAITNLTRPLHRAGFSFIGTYMDILSKECDFFHALCSNRIKLGNIPS